METRKNLAREHVSLEWSIDELQAALLKETKILETGLYMNDTLANVSATPRAPFAMASFHTSVKGGGSSVPSKKK